MMALPGILATGARSATWYYRQVQQLAQLRDGTEAVFPLKMLQMPFEEVNGLLPHRMPEAGELLAPYLEEMISMDAYPYILANITLHEAIDAGYEPGSGPAGLIHLRGLLAAHFSGICQRVGILGTRYTMTAPYMHNILRDCGQEVVSLRQDHIKQVDRLRRAYYQRDQPGMAAEVYKALYEAYPEIQCFVLACTELSIALGDYPAKDRFVDLPAIQCATLFAEAAAG